MKYLDSCRSIDCIECVVLYVKIYSGRIGPVAYLMDWGVVSGPYNRAVLASNNRASHALNNY